MKREHEETCALLSTPPISNADRRAIADIRELSAEVERLMHDLTRAGEIGAELATRAERAEAERDALKRHAEAMAGELSNIAQAKYLEWDAGLNNLASFHDWAKSRARHTLATYREFKGE